MRVKISILLPLSLVLGVAAVQSGRTWLERQANEQARRLEAINQKPAVQFGTLVVAAQDLRYGQSLTASLLKEIPWPVDQLPAGAFGKVQDIFKDDPKRAVLFAIQANEPLLTSKVTGAGQRANLAAMIEKGAKAITVRVDDVVGVAGFVLPGDRVDVLLTRKSGENEASSDSVLQNIKVLAIDQKADERLDKPAVSRSVTLEVSTMQAQKLIVAQRVGTLTLLLRPAGEAALEPVSRVTSGQLGNFTPPLPRPAVSAAPAIENNAARVGVIRSTVRKEYNVQVERP